MQRIQESYDRSAKNLQAMLESNLLRLNKRIKRGRGPRQLEDTAVTLSQQGPLTGGHIGKRLSDTIMMFDGFVGVHNTDTGMYDSFSFPEYVAHLTTGIDSPGQKIGILAEVIMLIRRL